MTDARPIDDIEHLALCTVVELLDTLIDAGIATALGLKIGHYAEDIRRLGDTAAQAAADLELVLEQRQSIRQAVA